MKFQGPVGHFSAQARQAWYQKQRRTQQEADMEALACALKLFP